MTEWGRQHEKTVAATDEPEWAAICAEIAAAGYSAVEIWAAHCDPPVATETHARRVRAVMDDYGLTPIGYAGALTEASARVCQWLGTNAIEAPTAIRALGPLIRHVQIKDVRAPGSHECCPLGEGCVDIIGVVAALKEIGYEGWYSWEDEPEDRNSMDIAARMRELIAREIER
jgi:sugar phosphate isomerase/epimerase